MKLNGKELKRIRAALDKTQAEFAAMIGTSQGRYSKWERDEDSPSGKYALRILELSGGGMSTRPLGVEAPVRLVNVVGELQAGAWREAIEWAPDDQYSVPAYPPPGREDCDVQGFIIGGDSMNMYYPPGSLVFVEPTIPTGKTPKPGQHVLVSRRNKDGLYEATLKEYVVNEDGSKWLWPRSHHPEHQAPIAYRDNGAEEVTITGIVRYSTISAP